MCPTFWTGDMSDQAAPAVRASIFICYAKQDEAVADYVQHALNQAGYQAATFTTNTTAGDRWISSINLSLATADVVVILLSRAALESPWVLYEISASIASVEKSSHKRVIPVALDKNLTPSGVLAQYQWIVTSGDPQEVASSVVDALRESRDFDKAQERALARKDLSQVHSILSIEEEAWESKQRVRTRRANFVLLCIAAVSVVFVSVSFFFAIGTSIDRAAAVGVAAPAIAGIIGYVFGRFAKGVTDDGPHK
jgi:TIR domain